MAKKKLNETIITDSDVSSDYVLVVKEDGTIARSKAINKSKGLFATEAALKEAYPTPAKGDWAIVGAAVPGIIYSCTSKGVWTNTGQTGGGGDVDLTNYTTKAETEEVKSGLVQLEQRKIDDSLDSGSMYRYTNKGFNKFGDYTLDANENYIIKISKAGNDIIKSIIQPIKRDSFLFCKNGGLRTIKNPLPLGDSSFSVYLDFLFKGLGNEYIVNSATGLSLEGFTCFVHEDGKRLFIGVGSTSQNTFIMYPKVGERLKLLYKTDASGNYLYKDDVIIAQSPRVSVGIIESKFNIGGYYHYSDQSNLSECNLHELKVWDGQNNIKLHINSDFSLDDRVCVDMSGNNNNANIVDYSKPFTTYINTSENEKNETLKESIPFIFHKDKITTSDGAFADWVGKEDICGSIEFECKPNKYYLIQNAPYGGYIGTAGYSVSNTPLYSCKVLNDRYFVIKSERESGDKIDVYKIIFNYYRLPKESNIPDYKRVKIYELNSWDERIEYTPYSDYNNSNVLVLGDSKTAGEQWSIYLSQKLDIPKLFNLAIGGANLAGNESSISNDSSDPFDKRHIWPQIKYAPENLMRQIQEYGVSNDTGETVMNIDCIIISAGFNDANNDLGLGNWDAIKDSDADALLPQIGTYFSDIQSAFKYIITTLQTKVIKSTVTVNGVDKVLGIDCTNAKIIYKLPIQTSVTTGTELRLPKYVDVLKELCNRYAIPYIDSYNNSGISREIELSTGGKYLIDGIHPNKLGYTKIGEMIAASFRSMYL